CVHRTEEQGRRLATESASELFTKLVDKGVLIRDVSIPGYLRVTIGTEDENKAFLKALTSIL
ncbi:MAG TPA: hypothetical protein DCL05_00055, partial [Actinobacteria bacterium]|nr:hypothetical protein [Actinomycetota bacterium]